MSELFKDIPEFVEADIGECLAARTETLGSFRELGPPDLCHVIKVSGKPPTQRDLGSYHYCSGVEASSSASLAAYLNSLQFSIEDSQAWFGKGSAWKVRSGTYCCFNAFSRVDMRVEANIPGGVEAFVVDLHGNRHAPSPELWQETYLSALLRAIRYADDASYRLAGYRKLDPITTPEAEERFLKAAEALFFRGWQLGSDPEIQVATVVTNHLTSAIIKYFSESFRLDRAANLFERMVVKEPEVAALVAKSYIGMNEEIKAVKIMNLALQSNPQSYPILHVQVDFLLSKRSLEWAQKVAQQAVNSAPSEFVTWAKLAETYIELGQFDQALLTLNSCPMFTYNERDLHRMPGPAKTHLPVKNFIAESNLLGEDSPRENEADVALFRLPAPNLRGTFAKAYSLLTLLVSKIGWDELLRTRSSVFVMEEEYRMHKTGPSVDAVDGGVAEGDLNSSTRGVKGTSSVASESETATPTEIPTIRISTESSRTPNVSHARTPSQLSPTKEEESEDANSDDAAEMDEPSLEKPETAQANEESHAPLGLKGEGEAPASSPFSNKRLCERWLDNLFIVLYEDLRVYTIWRAEISHFKTQHMSYRKTGTEWEILGELAWRLHHKEEAKDAYQRCLDSKFSAKALMKLLEVYANEGDLVKSLTAAVRLTTYHHRWYMDAAYPSLVAHYLYKLGLTHGHAKIQYSLLSMNLPVGIFEIMQPYMKYATVFNVAIETPGAGPSRLPLSVEPELEEAYEEELDLDESQEEADREAFLKKKNDYIELQHSSSDELLSSLASYLSTFQTDLSAVSGQISELQGKSTEIEGRLNGRKAVIPALNSLLADISLPPALVLTLRDTVPAQNPDLWLSAITQLDEKLVTLRMRSAKVQAASELQPVVDGLRIKALNVLPPFLLSLIKPLKSASKGLSTNLAVLQTSLLLKYQPFYAFLYRHSPRIAKQVERGYVNAARSYYETAFRRYARSLTQIRTRSPEKNERIGVVGGEALLSGEKEGLSEAYERLGYAEVGEGGVVLSFMADDKDYKLPVEALFRSLSLVLLDNASAEFTFIVRFFSLPALQSQPPSSDRLNTLSPLSTPLESSSASFVDITSEAGGRGTPKKRPNGHTPDNNSEGLKEAERIWHEVFDSALESTSQFYHSILSPPPPAIPLLTIIRLNDRLLNIASLRGTIPLDSYFTAQKLSLWPVFRKEMDQHVDSLKRMADDAEGKGFAGLVKAGVKNGAVRKVAGRYAGMFGCVLGLSEESDEAMFVSMTRLRTELVRLIQNQSLKIKSLPERHSFVSSIYEIVMHELVSGPGPTTHPRLQSELSFFRTREEEARRKIGSE
ncbi:ChAPs family protein [Cryptococcus wingfieldii CBS 7118]|uniref:ChAPs family protein n=1 Tax=Cryptococcus wingfieldii CBS 7118 TaxID=1295528 RepID=A0A1E3JBQ7_9TREE|nr:ChAPs family protein [Cryptococcus wingfieldii CBS 7118]ODN98284.1 ChAPs family protein [Cryptococcus wingfieldii CBS 7118]